MYANDVDFHSLSEPEQHRLVHNRRVATNGQLVTEIPDETAPVRVFKKSLDALLLDTLEGGRFSTNELAERFGVNDADVRHLLNKYRRRGTSKFTGENTKFNLITDRQGIVRAKETRGAEHYYTLEKIPYFARVVDPTLAFSLLNLADRAATLPRIVEYVPGGKATELDEEYAYIIGEYWTIDPQEVFDYLTEYDREYVETSLLPLPIVDADDEYERVANRFVESEGVYKRARTDRNQIDQLVEKFENRVGRGHAGLRLYQAHVIDIADLRWYAKQERPDLLPAIDDGINNLVQALEPDPDESDSDKDVDTSEDLTEQLIEDQLRLALGDDPRTAREVHEMLESMVQSHLSVDDVEELLDRYARTGFINRDTVDGKPRYSTDFDPI
jgi:hypothetical protein